jgi:integrase
LVFTSRYGTPIDPRNFGRTWDARCAKAGVRKIKVHDARRTCGPLLADLDVHPRVAMRILRHADFKMTMEIYTVASSNATRDALQRLGNASMDDSCCTLLLYKIERGHLRRFEGASDVQWS